MRDGNPVESPSRSGQQMEASTSLELARDLSLSRRRGSQDMTELLPELLPLASPARLGGRGKSPGSPSPKLPGTKIKSRWGLLGMATVLLLLLLGVLQLQLIRSKTLVLYSYSYGDAEYEQNLLHYIKYGISTVDRTDHIIVVQETSQTATNFTLPPLPSNAKYVMSAATCPGWGNIGWAIIHGNINLDVYTYFIFLDAIARGPFLPSYVQSRSSRKANKQWTTVFTERIGQNVKLVGSTISCGGIFYDGSKAPEKRDVPHVESYVAATDKVGFQILAQDERIFACHNTPFDSFYYTELGASMAIFEAGFSLDSLMIRYQGIDWQDPTTYNCNERKVMAAESDHDGISLSPFDILFVKVSTELLEGGSTAAQTAAVYSTWMQAQDARGNLVHGQYALHRRIRNPFAAELAVGLRGPDCFESTMYKEAYSDLPRDWGHRELWTHYVLYGKGEGRLGRYNCSNILENPDKAKAALEATIAAMHDMPRKYADGWQ